MRLILNPLKQVYIWDGFPVLGHNAGNQMGVLAASEEHIPAALDLVGLGATVLPSALNACLDFKNGVRSEVVWGAKEAGVSI